MDNDNRFAYLGYYCVVCDKIAEKNEVDVEKLVHTMIYYNEKGKRPEYCGGDCYAVVNNTLF